jgi:adenylate kinase family enzyme
MDAHVESRPVSVGRRIVVWGATGSGKTTFARRLGAALGLGVVDLDEIRHANGWNSTPFDEFREILTDLLDGHTQGWVVAGSYSAIMDVYLSRADTLIWLHLPWRISFWRLLQRCISRAWTQEPVYEGSPARESFRLMFFDRESILLWSISHHRAGVRTTRSRIAALPPSVVVHELRSAREVEAFQEAVRNLAEGLESTPGTRTSPRSKATGQTLPRLTRSGE